MMIPYFAALMAMVLVSRSSDRKLERRYHAAIPAIVGGVALLLLGTTHSTVFSIALLSFGAAGIFSFYGPYYSLPCEFLTGFAAASGIALISSVAHLGGFIGPTAVGLIIQRTGSLYGGLELAGVSLLASAMLILALPKRMPAQAVGGAPIAQPSPTGMPTADIDP
jgi:MFS transporter, ACS family, tartrate transporter